MFLAALDLSRRLRAMTICSWSERIRVRSLPGFAERVRDLDDLAFDVLVVLATLFLEEAVPVISDDALCADHLVRCVVVIRFLRRMVHGKAEDSPPSRSLRGGPRAACERFRSPPD